MTLLDCPPFPLPYLAPALLSPPPSSHLWARRRTRSTAAATTSTRPPPTSPTLETRCHPRVDVHQPDPADEMETVRTHDAATPSTAASPGFWTTVACLAVIAGTCASPGLASPVPTSSAAATAGTPEPSVGASDSAVFAEKQEAVRVREEAHGGDPSADGHSPGADLGDRLLTRISPRQDSSDASASSSTTTSTANSTLPASSSSSTTAATLPTAPSAPLPFPTTSSSSATDLSSPAPFDTTLSYNLSDGCVTFFAGFLQDPRMTGGFNDGTGCLSFGLLQSASSQWKKIANNATLLNTALSDICLEPMSAPTADRTATCSAWMAGLASGIVKKSACASDIAAGNAVANMALNGFRNYDLMQQVACLKDPDTDRYCYLEAVNADQPDDGYLYNLATGQMLPPTTTPTCSKCSKTLLDTYASAVKAGSNTSYAAALPKALSNATSVVNQQCGNDWVAWVATSAAGRGVGVQLGATLLCVAVAAVLLLL